MLIVQYSIPITGNCQNYPFLYRICPLFCINVSLFKRTIVLHFNGCSNICWEKFQWMQQNLLGKEVCVCTKVYQCVHQSLSVDYFYKFFFFFFLKIFFGPTQKIWEVLQICSRTSVHPSVRPSGWIPLERLHSFL